MSDNYYKIVRLLADGVDPITGEILPNISPYNQPMVIRALFAVLENASNSQKAQVKKKSHLPKNHGNPWSETEKNSITNLFRQGVSTKDIALQHGRTTGAIHSELVKQGLVKFDDHHS